MLSRLRKALHSVGLVHDDLPPLTPEEAALWQAVLHPDAHEDGGLACNDAALLAEMRECIMQWIKQVGRQILSGSFDLVNVSFPVKMFEPRSFLQKLSDPWVFPRLLHAAATEPDPLERMKLLITWFIAGLHRSLGVWQKPFNPILGETWQAVITDGDHRQTLHVEQLAHHPPVTAYELEGAGGAWRFSGWTVPAVVPVVKFYGIKTMAKGNRRLVAADGSAIDVYTPAFAIKGAVYAHKPRAEVLGTARFIDRANRLEAVLHFGPVRGSRHAVLARADAVAGEIYKLPVGAPSLNAGATPDMASGAFQRTATEAQPLVDLDARGGNGAGTPPRGSLSSSGGAEGQQQHAHDEAAEAAEAAAIYDAVHGQLGDAPVDADPLAAARASGTGSATAASPSGAGASGGSASRLPFIRHRRTSSNGSKGVASPTSAGRLKQVHSSSGGGAGAAHMRRSSTSTGDLWGGGEHGRSSGGGGGGGGVRAWLGYGGGGGGAAAAVPGVAVARVEGSWLSHLNIDSTRYWTLSESKPSAWRAVDAPLPSDSRYREDLAALLAGDGDGSQRLKTEMEHRQRADRKLREAAGVFEHA